MRNKRKHYFRNTPPLFFILVSALLRIYDVYIETSLEKKHSQGNEQLCDDIFLPPLWDDYVDLSNYYVGLSDIYQLDRNKSLMTRYLPLPAMYLSTWYMYLTSRYNSVIRQHNYLTCWFFRYNVDYSDIIYFSDDYVVLSDIMSTCLKYMSLYEGHKLSTETFYVQIQTTE